MDFSLINIIEQRKLQLLQREGFRIVYSCTFLIGIVNDKSSTVQLQYIHFDH